MKPYYERAGMTIYHGDCRQIVPSLGSFDVLLTDPPYGIGEARGKNKSRTNLAVSKDYGTANWDDAPPATWVLEMARSVARWQIIFGGNFFNLPPASCWLVWDKDNGESDFADCELAWTNLPSAVRRKRYRWAGMLQEHMDAKEPRFHPTQKPLAIVTWALAKTPPEVETVIDPFMGSGTTLVSARDLGKKAVGIEAEERYCEIAAKRLAQGVLAFGEAQSMAWGFGLGPRREQGFQTPDDVRGKGG